MPYCFVGSSRTGVASARGTTAYCCPGYDAGLGSRGRRLPGGHPGLAGGLWLWMTLVLSVFHAVVVPSGFRTTVQPRWWMTTWW